MNRPIALFDSGVGGLTVLKSISNILPRENYLYFADNGYFPYGTKPPDELRLRLTKLLQFISNLNPKVIVVACNTASLHVEYLQNLTSVPIVDVIVPTCNYAKSISKNKKVCLLATDATVHAQRYQQFLQKVGIDVVAVPCSTFVPIAESGVRDKSAMQVISNKLQPIARLDFDTVILGCTHFGLIQDEICNVLGNRNYVQCGDATASALYDKLMQANSISSAPKGDLDIISTGKSESTINVCGQLLLHFDSVSSAEI